MALYMPLPKGCVRLLRLLPPSGDKSRIECQLITCSLLDSRRTHSYEALSYVWGLEKIKEPIWIEGLELSVGANLYAALSHLRDCFVERILWIDAICINQGDDIEKGHQVESMAKIYAKASRVIVWLGEATGNSDQALEVIRAAAEEQTMDPLTDETSKQAILTLLERKWFQRIWVLQEIAAARHILIKCGIAEIDGYAFCSGLSVLRPFDMRPDLQALIPPVAYLIRGAVFRRKHRGDEIGQPDRFSLNIRPLSELVDMYHTRKATILLDKVYALSGMSSDDPDAAGLKANYKAAWRDTFRKLIHFCLSDQISVSTWDRVEATVIEAKGYIFGEVSSAGEDATQHRRQNQDIIRLNRQHVEITWKDTPSHFGTKGKKSSRFNLQASAKAVEKGDVVCLLQGASTPTIVRLCAEFSTIIIIAVPLTDNVRKLSASVTTFPTDLLLVWDWDESQRKSQGGEDYEKLISSREVPKCPVADCQCFRDLDKAIRLWNFGLLLNRMERYEEAVKNIREAVDAYGNREGLRSVDEACHCSLREASEEPLRIMGDLLIDGKSANIEAKYKEESQTPLSWAAENGHEPLTRLLVDKGANVEAKDRYGRTPLSLAAETGHEAVVRLLVDMGAHIEAKDSRYSRTPLSWAAWNGHEAVVRLLVDKGADIEAKSIHSWTPLLWAADKGHEAVVRLLVDKGANIEAKDSSYSRTPLSWAAWNGHEAVVRLLADKGADTAAKSIYSQTPLMLADQKGHEPVVRLLADKGASLGWEDDDGQALLLWAAWNGYEAVVRLLIDKGTSIEARDDDGQTPLSRAAEKGYEAIVRLLIDKGANVEAEDVHGKTSLWWAARGGHEAVVRLLKSREIRPS